MTIENRPVVLCDIDNCISDDGWRISKINKQHQGEERYHEYHTLAGFDEPRMEFMFAELKKKVSIAPHYTRFIFLTARPVQYHAMTEYWLRHVAVIRPEVLVMRPKGNTMSSPKLKEMQVGWLLEESLNYNIDRANIAGCYDDHPEVVAMYKAKGLPGVQVAIHNLTAYNDPLNTAPTN